MQPITLFWHDAEDGTYGRATVDRSPCLLGRSSEADVQLPFPFVSGRHARLTHDGAHWWIEDLGSTNGIVLDNQRVERARLVPGGSAALGRLRLRWETSGLADATIAAGDLINATAQNGDDLTRLRVLLDLQRDFEAGFSAPAALGSILQAVLDVSEAERACILLRESDDLRYAAGRRAAIGPVDGEEFRASRSVVDRVLETSEALFEVEGLGQGELASASIAEQELRAVAAMPLRQETDGTIRGVLYADSTHSMHRLRGLDREVLLRLAHEVEAILARIELRRADEERQRQEQELAFARRTQEQLLPRRLPALRGWTFVGHCIPSREVGGDFYDLTRVDDERVLAVVADVSGKGVAASLLAASAQASLPMALRGAEDPGTALARVNDFLHDRSDAGRFVTAFTGLLEADGSLTWMSAGHNPAYLWRADSGAVEELGMAGIVLGAMESEFFEGRYAVQSTRLAPGDMLLVYSDGVTEAEAPDYAQYGEERLIDLFKTRARDGASAVKDAVLSDVEAFVRGAPASDDLTLLVIERTL